MPSDTAVGHSPGMWAQAESGTDQLGLMQLPSACVTLQNRIYYSKSHGSFLKCSSSAKREK